MDLLYLDYNCFQRLFDDPTQARIQMEALACQEIFNLAEKDMVQLVWSFMHQDETMLCPFAARKLEALRLASLCKVRIGPKSAIRSLATDFQKQASLSAKDAIHLACAIEIRANCFLTCDDRLIKRGERLKLGMAMMNPVDYVRQEVR